MTRLDPDPLSPVCAAAWALARLPMLAVTMAAIAATACTGDSPFSEERCDTPPCPVILRSTASPIRLDSNLRADWLVIEPGVTIQVGPTGSIEVNSIEVNGTPDRPVTFEPASPGGTWGGIEICCGGPVASVIRHAEVEGAGVLIHNTQLRVEHTAIRGAPSHGIAVSTRGTLVIRGGSIEDNGGTGIAAGGHRGGGVVFEEPVRITGNGAYGVSVHMAALKGVLSTQDGWDAIQGNARDTIIAMNPLIGWGPDTTPGPVVVRKGAVVRTGTVCPQVATGYALAMEPGARLAIGPASCPPAFVTPVPLTVNSTADEPVEITGTDAILTITADDTVRIRHASIHGVNLVAHAVPALLEDVQLDSGRIELGVAGSRIVRAHIANARSVLYAGQLNADPPIVLGAGTRMEHTLVADTEGDGVTITGDGVVITDCTISGSAGHGVNVIAGSSMITRCNLEQNAGVGVNNGGVDEVDARDNWWGDPAGPSGPAGDGVAGSVAYTPFRMARFQSAIGF